MLTWPECIPLEGISSFPIFFHALLIDYYVEGILWYPIFIADSATFLVKLVVYGM